jgi:hypothetical protein
MLFQVAASYTGLHSGTAMYRSAVHAFVHAACTHALSTTTFKKTSLPQDFATLLALSSTGVVEVACLHSTGSFVVVTGVGAAVLDAATVVDVVFSILSFLSPGG